MHLQEAVPSVIFIHLANTSYRLGRVLDFDDPSLPCKDDPEANREFFREIIESRSRLPKLSSSSLVMKTTDQLHLLVDG
jgi:hypothetical protein